jgi:hypothetical protein
MVATDRSVCVALVAGGCGIILAGVMGERLLSTAPPSPDYQGEPSEQSEEAVFALAQDRVRRRWALSLNVIAPGVGLIILRREWFGLTLTILFVILAQTGVYGLLYHGPGLSPVVAGGAAAAAIVVWVFAQWLVWTRAARVLGAGARRRIRVLLEQAEQAVEARRYADAIELLGVAVAINDEEVNVRLALARLLTVMGHFGEARRAWEAVLDLDVGGALRAEAVAALARLPES